MPVPEKGLSMSNQFKILIVDDENINIQIISAALKNEYDLISALNGFTAIELVKREKPDLILLDVMMPEFNGFDVCRAIKADVSFADIPVVFLTALDTQEGELQGLAIGGIDYLTKPVNIELLKVRVHNHLELKGRNDLLKEQRDLLARQKNELETALSRIKRLEGIIPICMHCKSIRSGDDSWHLLEEYFSEHTDAFFSHGICPSCVKVHYPDVYCIQD
jgi:response regulator RpfG family c-di-GMP phosphodiesterase